MKNILYPTDFSTPALNAYIYALHIADFFGAKITTSHVYEHKPLPAAHMRHTLEEFYKTAELERFEDYKDATEALNAVAHKEGLDRVKVEHVMERGETLIKTILRVVKEQNSDFIVMGTKGASGLRAVFQGSVAGEVMEHAPTPLLAVPDAARFDGKLDHIAFFSDYSEKDEAAFRILLEFAEPFQPNIYILNRHAQARSDDKSAMEAFKHKFPESKMLHYDWVTAEQYLDQCFDYLESKAIDIAAIRVVKTNFLQELFNKNEGKQLAYQSRTPILGIPDVLCS